MKTILVVDDTPDNITILKEVLGRQYRLRIATSGLKALEICREAQKPDLVLLDILMPGMDGYEVCTQLKADSTTASIPVIFITAMDADEDEEKGLKLGAVDYITKPISPSIVNQRVKTHLSLQSALQKVEELSRKYSSYLSPELVQGLRAGNISNEVSSRRRHLTIFFSDIQGFTAKSEIMSPESMTKGLNYYFESMAAIVTKYGGTLDKYIGDAVMVFFGDPESQGLEADALACVQMALEMQATIPQIQEAWKEMDIPETLRIRIGIATGSCTVGNFGSKSQLTYTILGPSVNLASRLESNGIVGGVVVAEETWNLVKNDFKGTALPPLQLKGISQPINAWSVASR